MGAEEKADLSRIQAFLGDELDILVHRLAVLVVVGVDMVDWDWGHRCE